MIVQTELALPEPKPKRTWGGKRTGAGRKRRLHSDPAHRERPEVKPYQPQHVVLRCCKGVPRLRCEPILKAMHEPLAKMREREDCRIVHLSIQADHVHLLVEADDKDALATGMQQFTIAAARAINKALGRRGKVFAYRYHATPVCSPRQMRHVLAYVLNNWRRHDEDERSERARFAKIDPYSSAIAFDGWREAAGFEVPPWYTPLPVAEARTWLLTTGWKQHHPRISYDEVPGPLRSPASRNRTRR